MDYLYSIGNTFGKDPLLPTKVQFSSKSKVQSFETYKSSTIILTVKGELFYKVESKEVYRPFQLITNHVDEVSLGRNYFVYLCNEKIFIYGFHPFLKQFVYGKAELILKMKNKILKLKASKRCIYFIDSNNDMYICIKFIFLTLDGKEEGLKVFGDKLQIKDDLLKVQTNIKDPIKKINSGYSHVIIQTKEGKAYIFGSIFDKDSGNVFLEFKNFTELNGFNNETIIDICSGKRFSLFLTSSRNLYFIGILHDDFERTPKYITNKVTIMSAYLETYFIIKNNCTYINGVFKDKSYQRECIHQFKTIDENITTISSSYSMFIIGTYLITTPNVYKLKNKDIFFQFK